MGRRRIYPDFAHSVAGLGSISTRREEKKVGIRSGQFTNTSSWSFFIPERNTMISSNQAQLDERIFPFQNKEMIETYQSDKATDILFEQLQMSNGSLIIRYTIATTIQGIILIRQVI